MKKYIEYEVKCNANIKLLLSLADKLPHIRACFLEEYGREYIEKQSLCYVNLCVPPNGGDDEVFDLVFRLTKLTSAEKEMVGSMVEMMDKILSPRNNDILDLHGIRFVKTGDGLRYFEGVDNGGGEVVATSTLERLMSVATRFAQAMKGLPNEFVVYPKDKFIEDREAFMRNVRKLLKDLGFYWDMNLFEVPDDKVILCNRTTMRMVTHPADKKLAYAYISADKLLAIPYKHTETIVGGRRVKMKGFGDIQVGCKTFTTAEIDRLIKFSEK